MQLSSRTVLLLLFFGFLTLTFFLALYLDARWMLEPEARLYSGGMMAVFFSLGLLAADTFLPTPSSVVLLANGYLFGFWPGAVLSVAGLMIGNAAGFLLARYASQWLERKFPSEQRFAYNPYLERWGKWALAISRPVPVLAESVLLLSGSSKMSFLEAMAYCLLGTIPLALVYAFLGASAVEWASPLIWVSCIALVLAVLLSLAWMRKIKVS